MYIIRTLLVGSPRCDNLSYRLNRVERIHCSREKILMIPPSAQLSNPWDPPQFLSHNSHWNNALKPNICWRIGYIDLLVPYLQHVINTFNTCLQGPTHQFLTDTDRIYNLGDLGLPHHSLCPSQLIILCFPLRVLSGLRLTIQPFFHWTKECTNPNLMFGTLY
jgi:hypothetical protein